MFYIFDRKTLSSRVAEKFGVCLIHATQIVDEYNCPNCEQETSCPCPCGCRVNPKELFKFLKEEEFTTFKGMESIPLEYKRLRKEDGDGYNPLAEICYRGRRGIPA